MGNTTRQQGLTIAWVIGLLVALSVAEYVAHRPGPAFGDLGVARWIQRQPFATLAATGNDIAYSHVSIPIGFALALLALLRRRFDLAFLLGATAFLRPMNSFVKELVERPRPNLEQLQISELAGGYSYPSGHAFGSALLFFSVIVCVWRLPLPRWSQIAGTIALCVVTAVCGMARVYVGAHWPTDVGGAWLNAALWIGLLARIAAFIRLKFGPMDHF